MKIHFGIMEDCGDYEHPLMICDETLCGCTGEIPTENSTNDWREVDCKKCLRLKNRYEDGIKEDEKYIVKQMGDMAEFFENLEKYIKKN